MWIRRLTPDQRSYLCLSFYMTERGPEELGQPLGHSSLPLELPCLALLLHRKLICFPRPSDISALFTLFVSQVTLLSYSLTLVHAHADIEEESAGEKQRN